MSRTRLSNKKFLEKLDKCQYGFEIDNFLLEHILTDDQLEYIWSLSKVKYDTIFRTQKITEDFVLKHIDILPIAIFYVKFSESFLREYKDWITWLNMCEYQNLTENFIREHIDKLDWDRISEYQNLSINFIREFKDKLDWDLMKINPHLTLYKLKKALL